MADSAGDLNRAYAAFSKGSLEESSRLCRAVLQLDPRDARALHLAAAIALRRNDPATALGHVDAAMAAAPGDALKHQVRGVALRALGRGSEAEQEFREALRISPAMHDAHASLGFCALDRGDFDAAERHLQESLRLRPQAPDVLNALGNVFMGCREIDRAAASFESALRLNARMPQAWNNLGMARLAQRRVDEAIQCLQRSLVEAPNPTVRTNLGNALHRAGRQGEAEQAYREAIAAAPELPVAWQNLGNLLREANRLAEARDCLERSVTLSGSPDARFSLAITLLQMGELARGWQEYRWRDSIPANADPHPALEAALAAGKPVELLGEQGLGDALFFLRWAPALGARKLRWSGDPRLLPLLATSGFFEAGGSNAEPAGCSLYVADLPARLASTDYPAPLPLRADPGALEAARAFLRAAGPPPYVAVAWRGGKPSTGPDEYIARNLPIEGLATVLRPLKATFISIQRRPQAGENAAFARALGRDVLDASDYNEDLVRMAGLLAAIDRYVGVSTTNVHIAASLGRPASILVARPWEWRDGHEGPGSPWFPTFRLYREAPLGGWQSALEALAADLAADPAFH